MKDIGLYQYLNTDKKDCLVPEDTGFPRNQQLGVMATVQTAN